jgi:hypothetical protein
MQNFKINIFLTPIPFNKYNLIIINYLQSANFNENLSMNFYPCKMTTIQNNLPHKTFPNFLKSRRLIIQIKIFVHYYIML